MLATEKFPEDIENTIYQLLVSDQCRATNGMTLNQVVAKISEQTQTQLEPEPVFRMIRRMCYEGMVMATTTKMDKFVGAKFDPTIKY